MRTRRQLEDNHPVVATTVLVCMLLGFAFHTPGCAPSTRQTGLQATQRFGPAEVTPDTVNGMTLAFADDHIIRIKEAMDTLTTDSTSLEHRARLNTMNLRNAESAIGIASSPNPIVAMIDMVVMVSLQREAVRRAAIDRTLTTAQRRQPESYDIDSDQLEDILEREDRLLLLAFTGSDREIRALAEQVFWDDQLAEIDRFIHDWWVSNPYRRSVAHVRLKDFAVYRATTVETLSERPSSILALLHLDPLASMDPTTREIAQARMLADRVNYQLQRLPLLVSMHAKGLLYEALTTDELVSVIRTLEGTENSIGRFVDAVDRLPQDVETEREAAIDQLAEVLAAERKAAIDDLEAAVARQRDELLLAIEESAEPLQDTLAELNSTLRTASVFSSSVTETVRSVDHLTTKMHERSASSEPADRQPNDIADYQRLVDSAVDGVGGIERSLTTIDRLLAPEAVDDAPSRLQSGVAVATAGSKELVDHVFRRGIQFAAIVLLGWVIAAVTARLLAARLLRRSEK